MKLSQAFYPTTRPPTSSKPKPKVNGQSRADCALGAQPARVTPHRGGRAELGGRVCCAFGFSGKRASRCAQRISTISRNVSGHRPARRAKRARAKRGCAQRAALVRFEQPPVVLSCATGSCLRAVVARARKWPTGCFRGLSHTTIINAFLWAGAPSRGRSWGWATAPDFGRGEAGFWVQPENSRQSGKGATRPEKWRGSCLLFALAKSVPLFLLRF